MQLSPHFMQGPVTSGGLGMCATSAVTAACPHLLESKALIDGLISTVVSLVFGLLGGIFADKYGLTRRTLPFMAICLNLPHTTFYILRCLASPVVPVSLNVIAILGILEKAGYVFGFVANMLYMM